MDLGELLGSLATQHATEAVPGRVHQSGAVIVDGHYDALERAFRNLLVNAVEAQEGTARSPRGRYLEERVRNGPWCGWTTGDPGVPAELLDEVWNPDVTTKRRGTGLGLAIVRQTIQHHGGEVEVANRPEGGAVFTVALPLPTPDRHRR